MPSFASAAPGPFSLVGRGSGIGPAVGAERQAPAAAAAAFTRSEPIVDDSNRTGASDRGWVPMKRRYVDEVRAYGVEAMNRALAVFAKSSSKIV